MIVKRFTATDSEAFFKVNGNEEVMRFIRPVKSRAESDAFLLENILFYRDGSRLGRYAVVEKKSDRFLGTFSFLYLAGEADFHIGYALLPEAWGKGYATELVRAGINCFFEQTDKSLLFAITESGNHASQRVLLKSGFRLKGQAEENGKTLDLFYISRHTPSANGIANG